MGRTKSTGKHESAPDEAGAHFDQGVALQREERPVDAEAAFRRALEIRPGFPEALNNLGAVLRLTGRWEEAETICRRALELRPGYVAALYNLALVHRFRPGDPLISELERQLRLERRNGAGRSHLLVALGKAHDEAGSYDRAFDYYVKANREAGQQACFDAAAQRARIEAIKAAFPDPAVCPAGAPGPVTPIFVVGMPRSGKTLVESLLAQHPAVIALGEGRELQQALDRLLRLSGNNAPFPECLHSLNPVQTRVVGTQYLDAVRRRRPLPGARFCVNTLPGNYNQLGLIFRAFPEVRVIHCTRDPLDLCLFTYFKIFTTGQEYSFDLENLAAYFRNYREMMDHWQRLYGERILTVDYETLVRTPQETGRRLYAHCGLEFPPTCLDAAFTTDQIGHARHYEARLAPLYAAIGSLS